MKTFNKKVIVNPFLLREIHEQGLPDFRFYSDIAPALQDFKKESKTDLKLPPTEELNEATSAQARLPLQRDGAKHIHEMEVVAHNGVFDIWQCRICGMQHRAYSIDCCD
jgi:hypothetical protein